MKVVGTKLDNNEYEKFEKYCLDSGMNKSEVLRGMIKEICADCPSNPDDLNISHNSDTTSPQPTIEIIYD